MNTTLSPLERYQADVERGELSYDESQAEAVRQLQRLHEELISPAQSKFKLGVGLRRRIGLSRNAPTPRGIYLWGGVGRGKTYLANAFHDSLPFAEKLRIHFHRFMLHVHGELKNLSNTTDPLHIVADNLRAKTRVLCLDEFHVSDIADAMLLGRLLGALFERRVTLVTTSNLAPGDLYKDGLQRERFAPAIELIRQYTHVVHLAGETDHRLRALQKVEIYHSPVVEDTGKKLLASFCRLAPDGATEGEELEVNGRGIATIRCADGVVWFHFRDLCEGPRSPADYIDIARCFHTVIISEVPEMGPDDADKVLRFVHLIDEFYERNVNLIISAAALPTALYCGERFTLQFQRTVSRLQEMQSRDYLARKHLP